MLNAYLPRSETKRLPIEKKYYISQFWFDDDKTRNV